MINVIVETIKEFYIRKKIKKTDILYKSYSQTTNFHEVEKNPVKVINNSTIQELIRKKKINLSLVKP